MLYYLHYSFMLHSFISFTIPVANNFPFSLITEFTKPTCFVLEYTKLRLSKFHIRNIWSFEPLTISSSLITARLYIQLDEPVNVNKHSSFAMSHTFIVLSADPEHKFPLLSWTREKTVMVWPYKVVCSLYDSQFQILIVWSVDPEDKRPLKRGQRAHTAPLCPTRVASSFCFSKFHILSHGDIPVIFIFFIKIIKKNMVKDIVLV